MASAGTNAGGQVKIELIEVCYQSSWYRPGGASLTAPGILGITLVDVHVVIICTIMWFLGLEPGFFVLGHQGVDRVATQVFEPSDSGWSLYVTQVI